MKKAIMLAAVLAMALVAAAPALAQATAEGGDVQVQYQDCMQVILVAGQQTDYGNAGAVSGDIGSAAAADVAQELGVSVEAVQNCIQAGSGISVMPGVTSPHGTNTAASGPSSFSGSAVSGSGGTVGAGSPVAGLTTLPDTGGLPLPGSAAGVLLAAGCLLLRRMLR